MRNVTRWAAALALGLALGACGGERDAEEQQRVRTSTIIAPEPTRLDAVPEEEPAVARAQWRAVNDATRSVTGNLRVSIERVRGGPLVFAFANGITIRAQSYSVVPADSRSGAGGQSFAALLAGDPRVRTHLYRVLEESVTQSAAQGGLCGREASTRYMAVSEFVDGSGRWVFKLAAFRGNNAPPSDDLQHCGSYSYTAQ